MPVERLRRHRAATLVEILCRRRPPQLLAEAAQEPDQLLPGREPPRHEPGARETAFVEGGGLTLHVDGAQHDLRAGDCVTFDADLPHHFANHSEEEAVLLAIVSAGLRRS